MCTQIGNKDYIQVVFVSQVKNQKSYINIKKYCNYGIVTLLIISTNKHDQHCNIIVPMKYAIRLCNLMWENVSLVNPVHLLKFVKVFSLALVHYVWITLKELYGSHSLTFNYLVEAEIGPARTTQELFLRTQSLKEEKVLPSTTYHK